MDGTSVGGVKPMVSSSSSGRFEKPVMIVDKDIRGYESYEMYSSIQNIYSAPTKDSARSRERIDCVISIVNGSGRCFDKRQADDNGVRAFIESYSDEHVMM